MVLYDRISPARCQNVSYARSFYLFEMPVEKFSTVRCQTRTNKTRDELKWKRCSLLPLFDSSGRLVSADRPRQWLDKISGQCGRKQVYYGWWMEFFTVALWEIWEINMAWNLVVWATSIREQKLTWWTFRTENLLMIVLFLCCFLFKNHWCFAPEKSIVKFTCCSMNA